LMIARPLLGPRRASPGAPLNDPSSACWISSGDWFRRAFWFCGGCFGRRFLLVDQATGRYRARALALWANKSSSLYHEYKDIISIEYLPRGGASPASVQLSLDISRFRASHFSVQRLSSSCSRPGTRRNEDRSHPPPQTWRASLGRRLMKRKNGTAGSAMRYTDSILGDLGGRLEWFISRSYSGSPRDGRRALQRSPFARNAPLRNFDHEAFGKNGSNPKPSQVGRFALAL